MALLNTLPIVLDQEAIQKLQSNIKGVVITPDHSEYDSTRGAWNLFYKHQSAVIVVAEESNDVVEAVRFAHNHNLGIAMQSRGHGFARTAENTLLIVMTNMTDVEIDVDAQTAWVGGGTKWGKILAAAQEFGLAPLLGSSPDVGAVGYTLGGGMGWLARKYGLSADNVLAFELVTTDGKLIRVSADENADLFWALRGGGGNFGTVTAMQIKLFPVTTVYAGNLFYPIEQAKAVFTHYREWIANAPDELTSSILVMNFPPIPEIPDFLRGQSFAMVRGCYTGDIEKGEALLKFWRDWQAPTIDDFKVMSFGDAGLISDEPIDPSPAFSTSLFLQSLSDDVIDILLKYGISTNGSSPITVAEVRHAGGAISRSVNNAYGKRSAQHLLQVISFVPAPELHEFAKQYWDEMRQELEPYGMGVYLNFLEAEELRKRTVDGYSEDTYRRLMGAKADHDAENRFDYSLNIPPAIS